MSKGIVKVRIFTKGVKQEILFLNKSNYLTELQEHLKNIEESEIERIYIDYDVSQEEIDYQEQLKDFAKWSKQK